MKKILLMLAVLIAVPIWFSGLKYGEKLIPREAVGHQHAWSKWEAPINSTTNSEGSVYIQSNSEGPVYIQFRQCTNCGFSEYRKVLIVK